MKVILKSAVAQLGRAGDVKEVSPGFGRNYLLPKGLATMATAASIASWEKGKEKRSKLAEQQLGVDKELAVPDLLFILANNSPETWNDHLVTWDAGVEFARSRLHEDDDEIGVFRINASVLRTLDLEETFQFAREFDGYVGEVRGVSNPLLRLIALGFRLGYVERGKSLTEN